MRAVDIIIKKREKGELTGEEIKFFVDSFTRGEIPDYQVAAWAMAVLLNGMTPRETADLTLAMAHSGEILDLSGVVDIAVDKHSSGGVGDKTTFVVLPVVAACGLPVGKMSGRGLGFSGGTLDKIESIPGYRVDLDHRRIQAAIKRHWHCADRSEPGSGSCRWQTVCLARRHRNSAIHPADCFIHYEQENCCRGAGHPAGCKGWPGCVHGKPG